MRSSRPRELALYDRSRSIVTWFEALSARAEGVVFSLPLESYRLLGSHDPSCGGALAEDVRSGRHVIVRLLHSSESSAEIRERAARELTSLQRLRHPNIAGIVDSGEVEGRAFIVEELVDGRPLRDWLERRALAVLETLHLGRVVADALAHAHFCGITHACLSVDDVIVGPGGDVKVVGLEPVGLRATERGVGPHRAAGGPVLAGPFDEYHADVRRLGSILYHCLTGHDPDQILERRARKGESPSVPRLDEMREGLPEQLVALVGRLLAEPSVPVPSAEQLASDLWALEVGIWEDTGPESDMRRTAQLLERAGYRVVRSLGSGGVGRVWLAEDRRLQQEVAIKTLHRQLLRPESVTRFLREARAVAQLDHPHVISILDILEQEGQLLMVMPFLHGGSLRDQLRLANPTPLSVESVVRWGREAASGLAHAHEHGVVHRDVKPDNLLLSAEGQLRIADFGLARVRHAHTAITPHGALLGTAGYMSPEQVRGDVVDHRGDLFSLGATLYELLSNRRPFDGRSPKELLRAASERPLTPLELLRPDAPVALLDLVDRMLQTCPSNRPQSAGEVASELLRVSRRLRIEGSTSSRGQ